MSSQPFVINNSVDDSDTESVKSAKSEGPPIRRQTVRGIMDPTQMEEKVAEFRKYIASLNQQINKESQEINNSDNQDEDISFITDLSSDKKKNFYYFIGRLNPPHEGHIHALEELIRTAAANGSVPLILLGSGPAGGARTLDNPIDFKLKSRFITAKLRGEGYIPYGERAAAGDNIKGRYVIQEMTNPISDVTGYIIDQITKPLDPSLPSPIPLKDIIITHMAGDKAEDAVKMKFMYAPVTQRVQTAMPEANVETGVAAIAPVETAEGTSMSATKVRKDAYRFYLEERGARTSQTKKRKRDDASFNDKYSWFYGDDFTEPIYSAIIQPALALSDEQIQEYIDLTKLPAAPKKKKEGDGERRRTTKKGGRKTRNKKGKSTKYKTRLIFKNARTKKNKR